MIRRRRRLSADGGVWSCACGRRFQTTSGLSAHGRFCEHSITEGEVEEEAQAAADVSGEATGSHPALASGTGSWSDYQKEIQDAAFKGLTRLRLQYSASNSQVEGIKDMIKGIIQPMRTELHERLQPLLLQPSSAELEGIIAKVTDVFHGLTTAYKEEKMRAQLLPDLSPTRRVIGTRQHTVELEDGRSITTTVEDIVYDFDIKRHLEAMFEYNPSIAEDYLSSVDRWHESWRSPNNISDICDGAAFRQHPLVEEAVADGRHVTLFQYYMDGIGLTHPLGAAKALHKVAASYVAVLNFAPAHRTSPHCIIPISICYEKDFTRYDPAEIVCGPVGEPYDGSSLGSQMRRFKDGVQLCVPAAYKGYRGVVYDRASARYTFNTSGGLVLVSADTPAAALLFGTKISVGPSTVSICRGCFCQQINGSNRRAHAVTNSFLPWVEDRNGLHCELAALLASWDPDHMGALQVHKLRTIKENLHCLRVAALLNAAEVEYYLMQIGIRSFMNAFSRMPYNAYLDSCQDLMHVEYLGNVQEHLAAFIWKMVRQEGWCTIQQLNNRFESFPYWGRGTRRKSYIIASTACDGPMSKCTVGSGWTAHNTMLFACYSIELLHVFIPPNHIDHPLWTCWCLHYKYLLISLQTSFTLDDIETLDRTIIAMQTVFLATYGEEDFKPKMHYAQHFPHDILKWGPLRLTWCMMFEHMNQVIKNSGLRSNFLNTLLTTSTRLGQKLAFSLYCREHQDYLKPTVQTRCVEYCVPGSSATVDALISLGMIALDNDGSVVVKWLSKLTITRVAFRVGDYVRCSTRNQHQAVSQLCLLLNLLMVGDSIIAHVAVVTSMDSSTNIPALTWAELKAANSLDNTTHREFIYTSQTELTLLHPVSRPQSPSEVTFLSW